MLTKTECPLSSFDGDTFHQATSESKTINKCNIPCVLSRTIFCLSVCVFHFTD